MLAPPLRFVPLFFGPLFFGPLLVDFLLGPLLSRNTVDYPPQPA